MNKPPEAHRGAKLPINLEHRRRMKMAEDVTPHGSLFACRTGSTSDRRTRIRFASIGQSSAARPAPLPLLIRCEKSGRFGFTSERFCHSVSDSHRATAHFLRFAQEQHKGYAVKPYARFIKSSSRAPRHSSIRAFGRSLPVHTAKPSCS